MAKPILAFTNIIEASVSTITVTSEETGFEKENAFDWKTFDGWKAGAAGEVFYTIDYGSAVSVDYWAMAAHDLNDNSGTVQLQYSTDNFVGDTNDIGSLITPASNSPILHTFTTQSARYWRFKINSTTNASFIGVASIGDRLTMVRAVGSGFGLPFDSRDDDITNFRSEGGEFLGRTLLRKGIKARLTFTLQTLAFVRGDWRTFTDHAQLKPFWFDWNPDNSDVVFCWLTRNPSPPTYTNHILLNVGIAIEGLR